MPLTFFAHQVPALPLKLWRPAWFDGLALCIGSMAPDLAYPVGGWVSVQSHRLPGLVTWSVGVTVLACVVVRRWVAPTAFAVLPDAGSLRLRSYRVLAVRRPPPWQTITSALVGAGSHLLVDAFTHPTRWGAQWLGLDRVLFVAPLHGPTTIADVLQGVGHTAGTALGLVLLVHVGRRRLLERWYGDDAVRVARDVIVSPAVRAAFWSYVGAGVPLGAVWALATDASIVFSLIDGVTLSTVVAAFVTSRRLKTPPATTEAPATVAAGSGAQKRP